MWKPVYTISQTNYKPRDIYMSKVKTSSKEINFTRLGDNKGGIAVTVESKAKKQLTKG